MERFERIKKLGEGATGTVYKAFDNVSGLLVALKIPELTPEGINPSMHYAREVDLLKGIDHAGIVKIIDNGLDDGKPWVAYEFLKGHTLRELLASGKTFSMEEALKLGRDVARALAYIHDRGIIHRDINPNNIMITTDGKAKIMDFGIALKPGEPLPRQLAGTPGYMSPEAARGEEASPESDIYSLGLILYELLTGKPAYTGDSIPEVISKILANDFVDPGKLNPNLPGKVLDVIGKALSNKAIDRYQTADEFALALHNILFPNQQFQTQEPSKVLTSTDDSPPKLACIAGPYRGYSFDLGPTITTIGGEYADINLSRDTDIAPQHCWIVSEDGSWWLYDAEDSGGTNLGRMAIKRARLVNGDRITIGRSTFRWENPNDPNLARSVKEIEYAPVQPSIGNEDVHQVVQTGGRQKYQQVSRGGVSPVARGFLGSIIIIILAAVVYGFVLLPSGETKRINLVLEDYWVDISGNLTRGTPEVIISAVKNRKNDFTYNELENIELSNSFFFSLPGPMQSRQANLNRISLVITTLKALNVLRGNMATPEIKKEIEKYRGEIENIALPDYDRWQSRRDSVVGKLKQIEAYLEAKGLTEAQAQNPQTISGAGNEALKAFLDGYYLMTEASGKLSTDIARNAFDNFENAHDRALDTLDKSPNDQPSQTLVILSDYFMAKLRVDHLTNWSTEIMDGTIAFLSEGRDMLEAFDDASFQNAVPSEVDDQGYRVRGRLKAKYITLIDQFQQMTGATVPPVKTPKPK